MADLRVIAAYICDFQRVLAALKEDQRAPPPSRVES
jgi:hypothetical protein